MNKYMKKNKTAILLTLILALALPLFLMPISAAETGSSIEELIEMTKESEEYLDMLWEYQGIIDWGEAIEDHRQKLIESATKFGYYHSSHKVEKYGPYLLTGEPDDKLLGYGYKLPDYVTVDKVKNDIEKYFVSNFLNILYEHEDLNPLLYVGPDGSMYTLLCGIFGKIDNVYGRPDFATVRIKERSNNKITLEFDKIAKEHFEKWGLSPNITIQYTKTQRGWRISGATGGYYNEQDSIFAPEIPETADNSVVYIALASVSLVALAGVTLVSAKRKKAYIA